MQTPSHTRTAALVTGASSGIGRELARLLAADGHDVVLVARREDALRELAAEIEAAGGVRAHVLVADLCAGGAVADVRRRVAELGLTVDVLVNNAGLGLLGPFDTMPVDRVLAMVQLNVAALTELTRQFVPDMPAGGKVLNVASLAAFQPGPLSAVYHASKAYVVSLSEALAVELADRGITVTVLCPGPVDTEFIGAAGAELSGLQQRLTLQSPRVVAQAGYRGMVDGKTVVFPSALTRAVALGSKLGPRGLSARITQRIMRSAGAGR